MNRALIIALSFTLFLFSCKTENKNELSTLIENAKELKASIHNLDQPLLGMPAYRMTQLDTLVLIYDWKKANEKLLFVVDVKNDKLIKKAMQVGWGPCEFSLIKGIKADEKENAVYFIEPNKKQYFKLSHEQLVSKETSLCPDTVVSMRDKNNNLTRFTDLVRIKNGFLGYGPASGEGMFSILNAEGRVIENHKDFPVLKGTGEQSNLYGKQFYYGDLHKKEDEDRFTYIAGPGLFGIVDLKDNKLETLFEKEVVEAMPVIVGEKIAKSPKSQIGINFSYTTKNNIYIGYSHKTIEESRKKREGFRSEYILVYDWEGNPKGAYKPEHPLMTFTVSSDDSQIFGVANIPDPKLVSYPLKATL